MISEYKSKGTYFSIATMIQYYCCFWYCTQAYDRTLTEPSSCSKSVNSNCLGQGLNPYSPCSNQSATVHIFHELIGRDPSLPPVRLNEHQWYAPSSAKHLRMQMHSLYIYRLRYFVDTIINNASKSLRSTSSPGTQQGYFPSRKLISC